MTALPPRIRGVVSVALAMGITGVACGSGEGDAGGGAAADQGQRS